MINFDYIYIIQRVKLRPFSLQVQSIRRLSHSLRLPIFTRNNKGASTRSVDLLEIAAKSHYIVLSLSRGLEKTKTKEMCLKYFLVYGKKIIKNSFNRCLNSN